MDENKDFQEVNTEDLSSTTETGFILIDTPDSNDTNNSSSDSIEDSAGNDIPESSAQDFQFVESYNPNEPDKKKKRGKKKKEKKERTINLSSGKLALIIAALVLISALCGFGGSAIAGSLFNSGNSGNNISRTDGYTLEDATGSKLTVAEIVEKAADSVVEITTEATATDSWMMQYVTEGAGSGVIIDSEKGYIMTNNHVVADATKVSVTLRNGEQYDAKVIGVDSENDVAVIQINGKNLTAATYGNSDQLVVGELAVAIGNPLGELGGTVTSGIISALDREINVDGQVMTLLQTDASINPGNSGGGLFNQNGQFIGLVVAKSSGSDVEGLGFAIPINTAAEVAQQIIKAGGNISSEQTGEAVIGVTVGELSKSDAQQYGYDSAGLYITQISSINAQNAGFQIGDRFVSADGKKIKDYDALSSVLAKHSPGDKIKVVVSRNGKELTLETELVARSQISEVN